MGRENGHIQQNSFDQIPLYNQFLNIIYIQFHTGAKVAPHTNMAVFLSLRCLCSYSQVQKTLGMMDNTLNMISPQYEQYLASCSNQNAYFIKIGHCIRTNFQLCFFLCAVQYSERKSGFTDRNPGFMSWLLCQTGHRNVFLLFEG